MQALRRINNSCKQLIQTLCFKCIIFLACCSDILMFLLHLHFFFFLLLLLLCKYGGFPSLLTTCATTHSASTIPSASRRRAASFRCLVAMHLIRASCTSVATRAAGSRRFTSIRPSSRRLLSRRKTRAWRVCNSPQLCSSPCLEDVVRVVF